jgi:PelA/Pel-15E family pectate lyase
MGLSALLAPAAVIGTNQPAQPLTTARLATLPASERDVWTAYLATSDRYRRADQEFLAAELRANRLTRSTAPPEVRGTRGIPLDEARDWYRGSNALRLAEIIVSFQTPAGGWSKNLDLTQHRRAPGEHFAAGNLSRFSTPTDLDLPHDPSWNYVGTFDNGATTTQLRFLAKVIAALPATNRVTWRESFQRGLEYILNAQYPNGGWPQVWPLQGGYHDAITFNDSAMTAILDLLAEVATGRDAFAFVPDAMRQHATASLQKGLRCVLATQVGSDGQKSVWCQQYDPLTLAPASARNYEMPSLSSGESAGVMQFLMRLPAPDSNIVTAVRAAATWFERVAIRDYEFRRTNDDGRQLVAAPGSGPLWSRYYEIGSNRPIFGDRDKSIHDSVAEISRERRDGYSWFHTAPQGALDRFARWNQSKGD